MPSSPPPTHPHQGSANRSASPRTSRPPSRPSSSHRIMTRPENGRPKPCAASCTARRTSPSIDTGRPKTPTGTTSSTHKRTADRHGKRRLRLQPAATGQSRGGRPETKTRPWPAMPRSRPPPVTARPLKPHARQIPRCSATMGKKRPARHSRPHGSQNADFSQNHAHSNDRRRDSLIALTSVAGPPQSTSE